MFGDMSKKRFFQNEFKKLAFPQYVDIYAWDIQNKGAGGIPKL